MKVQLDSIPNILSEYLDTKVIPQYQNFSGVQKWIYIAQLIWSNKKIAEYVYDPRVRSMFPDGIVNVDEFMDVAKESLKYVGGSFKLPTLNFSISEVEFRDLYEIAKKYEINSNTMSTSQAAQHNTLNSQIGSIINNNGLNLKG